jgi:hypothetical protein
VTIESTIKALSSARSEIDATLKEPGLGSPVKKLLDEALSSVSSILRSILVTKTSLVAIGGLDAPATRFFENLSMNERDFLLDIVAISGTSLNVVVDDVETLVKNVNGLLAPFGAMLVYADKKKLKINTEKYVDRYNKERSKS